MSKVNQEQRKEKKLVSRREFLAGGGAVMASVLFLNMFTSCSSNNSILSTTPVGTTATGVPVPKMGGTMKLLLASAYNSAGGAPWEDFGPGSMHYEQCYDPLLRADSKGNIYPWLAEDYKIADDLTSITFVLTKGVKFHDGSDFNAAAAKWNLDMRINAKTQPNWDLVDIIDDYTIRLNLKRWANTLWSSFYDGSSSWMVSPAAFEKNGIEWLRKNPVGTGPFKFVSFQQDAAYKSVRNPDYWKNGLPYLDALENRYIADSITMRIAMQTREGDVMQIEPGRDAAELQKQGLNVLTAIYGVYAIIPDAGNADSPFSNQQVREAVEYAIDREGLARAFSSGYWKAPYQIPGADTVFFDPEFKLARKFDPDKARQLLAEAGYSSGVWATLLAVAAVIDQDVCVAVQGYLSAVGIQTELNWNTSFGKMISDANSTHSLLFFQPFGGTSNTISAIDSTVGATAMMNKHWLNSVEYQSLYNKMVSSPKSDINLTRACTDQMTREASVIPVTGAGIGWALQDYVMGGGWFARSMPAWWNCEQVWLNK